MPKVAVFTVMRIDYSNNFITFNPLIKLVQGNFLVSLQISIHPNWHNVLHFHLYPFVQQFTSHCFALDNFWTPFPARMFTNLVLKGLNTYSHVFQRFGALPVSWDGRSKRLVYDLNHPKLTFWYVAMGITSLGTLSSGYIVLKQVFVQFVPTWIAAVQMLLVAVGLFAIGYGLFLLVFGKEACAAWYNLVITAQLIRSGKF